MKKFPYFLIAGLVLACSGEEDSAGGDGDGDDAGDGDGDDAGDGDGPGDGDAGDGDGDGPQGDGDGDLSSPDPLTCADQEEWNAEWAALEDGILQLVNEERAQGAVCGGEVFGPAEPLVMDAALRCAARLHSKDMADQDYFSHDSLDGRSPWDRIEDAGFEGNASGENIAAGRGTAEETMEQWMGSSGHCANIMSPDTMFLGVGYYPGGEYGHLWTQTFGNEGW